MQLTGKLRLFSRDILVSLRLNIPHGHPPFPFINGNNISQIWRRLSLLHWWGRRAFPLGSRELVLATSSTSGLLSRRPLTAPVTTTTTITTTSPLPIKVSVSTGSVAVSTLAAVALPVSVPRPTVVIVLAPGPGGAMRRSRAFATRSFGSISVSVSVSIPVSTIR